MTASTGQRAPTGIARAAKFLLAAAAVEDVIMIVHSVHGAHTYADPGRLHVIGPALGALALTAALTALYIRRPGKLAFAGIVAIVGVFDLALFGMFHGGYLHGLKLIVFHAGAPKETIEWLFMSPDYALPDDVAFEVSGLLTLVTAIFVAYRLYHLFREIRRQGSGTGSAPGSPGRTPPGSEEDRRAVPFASSQRGGSMRLLSLAFRMLFDAPFKSLGTLIGVVVSVFLMVQQSSLLVGILGRVTSFVQSSGVDIWIMSLATESADATDSIPASRVGAVASTPGVAWAAPVVQGIGKVTRPDGVRENVKVLGVEPPRYAGLPRALAPGTTGEALRASGRIFINWNDRPTFAAAQPGDRIEIGGQAGIVSGFFVGMDPHSPFYYVYANIDDARALTSFPQDRVTFIAVGAAPGERIPDVKERLENRIPDVLVKTRAELSDMEERYFLVRTPVGVVFGMGTLVAAVIGAAIVAVTLYSTAVDRSRDYGTLKAIGARQRDILQLLLLQAWIFFVAGYALGMIAFLIVRHHYPQLPMVAPPEIIFGVAVAALASCTFASLAAIRRVLSLDPAIVFRA